MYSLYWIEMNNIITGIFQLFTFYNAQFQFALLWKICSTCIPFDSMRFFYFHLANVTEFLNQIKKSKNVSN